MLLAFLMIASRSFAQDHARAEIKMHRGRPMIFINGAPNALAAYSPVSASRRKQLFREQTARFFPHRIGAYLLTVPSIKFTDWAYFSDTPFWAGDNISTTPIGESDGTLDDQVSHVLQGDPNAYIIVRFGVHEPKSWRDLHQDQCFINEEGQRMNVPSLASDLYNEKAAEYSRAIIQFCESRPWANRIIGYANFERTEGTHEPLIHGWLFDHSPLMTARWRKYLQKRYKTTENLCAAYNDQAVTFENIKVPHDKLRGSVPEVSALLYFQNAKHNQALRDYLLLQRELYSSHFRAIAATMQDAVRVSGRKRFLIYDTFKQTLLGWSNAGFFDPNYSWPLAYPDDRSGSGGVGMSALFDAQGFDGLITPHDYQARGMGGIYEPEGSVDSAILRGKYFFAEMDTRTYGGTDVNFPARDDKEFAAVTWRNLASGWTRGFNSYWMDVYQDWFTSPGIHQVIKRQVQVLKESVSWDHRDVPGIAVILDDEAVLETNGNGVVFNQTIMWGLKEGLARCGVPYRVYLFDDLKLKNFPEHCVYYFPNLYRVDDERLKILREKVFKNHHVVVWGPGSGISDGTKISTESASRLTGFEFNYLPSNYPRRTQISNFSHPLTKGLSAGMILGDPISYGPCLYPKDGLELGRAWTKGGRDWKGLAFKDMAGWNSVFSTTSQLPADLWRNLARFGGAHVYSQSNDVVLADAEIIALHSLQSGEKRIALPGAYRVYDVVSGKLVGKKLRAIQFNINAPETRVFRVEKNLMTSR